MSDLGELLIFILASFLFVGILISPIIVGAYFVDKKSCLEGYKEYSPQYGLWSGCRIMYDGKMTPTEIIRNVNLIN